MKAIASVSEEWQRQRLILLAGFIGLCLLAWASMAKEASSMNSIGHLPACCIPQLKPWHMEDFLVVSLMWAVMMVAMMTPSAIPMLLTFAFVNRKRSKEAFVPTWIFFCGYLLVWTIFSFLVALVQWYLHQKALISPTMISSSGLLSGILVMVAGVFQFTPLKNTCLAHCQSPLSFLMGHWHEGKRGALLMGLKHGLYCSGCCWVLMLLLFVFGVMNIAWIALLTLVVLLEKIIPKKFRFSFMLGCVFVTWGTLLMLWKA